jgi:protein TonB
MSARDQGKPEPVVQSSHLSVRPDGDRVVEVRFSFETPQGRAGRAALASLLTHAAMVGVFLLFARMVPDRVYEAVLPPDLSDRIVWLAEPGPGGGGGGGNRMPEPPKPAELPGREKITVPAAKVPEPVPEPAKEPEPQPEITIPAQTLAAAATIAPGAIDTNTSNTLSRGSGVGSGAGPGQGSGIGPGFGGGTGGGVYRPGNGVTLPEVIKEVKPQYTAEAMRAKVQGSVWLECVVMPDGTCGRVEIIRSLDPTFGLDQEAVKAARQWRFRPGTRFGEPVPVLVTIELTFTLR